MAKLPAVRFVIRVDGRKRSLLSVYESKNGSLRVISTGGAVYRDSGVAINSPGSAFHGKRYREYKYSVHTSSSSTTANTLHRTVIFEDGSRFDSHNVTHAIKAGDFRFTTIYDRLCPNPSDAAYDVTGSKHVEVDMGLHDPSRFNLVISVLVGHRDARFDVCPDDYNIAEYIFAQFKVIVLWSFFASQATSMGAIQPHVTINPEGASDEVREALRPSMDGHLPEECALLFKINRLLLRQEFVTTLESWAAPAPVDPELMRAIRCGFYRSPDRKEVLINLGLIN